MNTATFTDTFLTFVAVMNFGYYVLTVYIVPLEHILARPAIARFQCARLHRALLATTILLWRIYG